MAHIININPVKEEFSVSIDFKFICQFNFLSNLVSDKELTSRIYNGRNSPNFQLFSSSSLLQYLCPRKSILSDLQKSLDINCIKPILSLAVSYSDAVVQTSSIEAYNVSRTDSRRLKRSKLQSVCICGDAHARMKWSKMIRKSSWYWL